MQLDSKFTLAAGPLSQQLGSGHANSNGEQGHVDTQKTRAKISREEGQPGSSRGSEEVAVTSLAREICMGGEVPATSPAAAVHGQLPRVQ